MKKRLNITIRENLVEKMKKYADQHETSLSNLIVEHFEKLLQPKLKKDISLVMFRKSLPK